MTAAVLSAACTGQVVIKNAQAVNKSYPGFFDDFSTALGGVCEKEG
jgi:5-enolpyruvylshikimate-3-phosphate synthase